MRESKILAQSIQPFHIKIKQPLKDNFHFSTCLLKSSQRSKFLEEIFGFPESWLISFLLSNSDLNLTVPTYLDCKTISGNLLSSYIEKHHLAEGTNKKPKRLFDK